MEFPPDERRVGGSVARVPGWLIFFVFVPLQIWFFVQIFGVWRWWTLPFFLLLGILGNRAARAPWLTQAIFPRRAMRHEGRRHVYQGILLLAAAGAWLVPQSTIAPTWSLSWPQPWLPLAFLVTLVKASLR